MLDERSRKIIESCDENLIELFREVASHWPCRVLEGVRSREQQEENVRRGVSETLNSKHLPDERGYARAADVVPVPIDWEDFERFRAFGGFVLGVASQMGIKIRWGGDWDGDRSFKDQTFHDLPHFELLD